MPEPDFFLKAGDTGGSLQTTLENSSGSAVDIQGSTVLFKMAPYSGTTITVSGTCTILQTSGTTNVGEVAFSSWPVGGVSTADWYRAEFQVTFQNGTVESFPNSGFFTIAVADDL